MKIFVTGVTGYIGQQIAAKLLEQGHCVHALCRTKPDGIFYDHPNLKIFVGDILDKRSLHESVRGCSQAYHLAGFVRPWAKRKEKFFEVNLQGTVNVIQAVKDNGVEKLVFSSTGAVFGASNGTPVTEESIRKVDFFTEYESSKFMAEERIQYYVRRGVHAVIVNPFRVYGPGLWTESNAVSNLIKSYVTGEWHVIPGDGTTRGSFSFIDDVVDGHILAMEKGQAGEKYILGGENVTFNEFFRLLRKVSARDYLLFRVPLPFLYLYAMKEEWGTLFGKEPLITRKWVKKYHHHLDCSSEKAIRELGYRITPLEEGLAKTLKWIAEEKKINF